MDKKCGTCKHFVSWREFYEDINESEDVGYCGKSYDDFDGMTATYKTCEMHEIFDKLKERLTEDKLFERTKEMFKVGDVVRLKSGGALMTVYNLNIGLPNTVSVEWFDSCGNLKKDIFNIDTIHYGDYAYISEDNDWIGDNW